MKVKATIHLGFGQTIMDTFQVDNEIYFESQQNLDDFLHDYYFSLHPISENVIDVSGEFIILDGE